MDSEEYLHQLERAIEIMQIGILITDLDGTIVYTNQAGAEMHGYQATELRRQNVAVLTPPELRKALSIEQIKSWKGLVRESISFRQDGTRFPARVMSEIVLSPQEEPWGIVTSYEDITERKRLEAELQTYREHLEDLIQTHTTELTVANARLQAEIMERQRTEEALRKSEERYRIVLETVPDPVLVYDPKGSLTYLNPAFARVFQWTLAESKGPGIEIVPAENLATMKFLFEEFARGKIIAGVETYLLARDKTPREVSLSGAGFFDHEGKHQGTVITLQDITERKQTEKEMEFLAYHDVLTGLPNRKAFNMRLKYELLCAPAEGQEKRRIIQRKWALLLLNLDRFKFINDTLGHEVGDEILQLIALRLQTCLRKSDYIFRFDGDEFTIILNNPLNYTDVAKVAQKIYQEIARPCKIRGHDVYLRVSIGISLYPDDGEDGVQLLKEADMAMSAAKKEGRGYLFFTNDLNQKALERMQLETDLHYALQQNQFLVYYQPVADESYQIIGMEALLRWKHPELGWISPTQFIPIAEDTGLIVPLGRWVLQTACMQAKEWYDSGYPACSLSVNLSVRQFKEPDLIDMVEQVLEETGMAPQCLKLEVTESGIMENPEDAIKKMQALRAKGIHFSIDDFGTGYSSLSYLKRLPIDILKIDRSFVMDATTDKDDQEIVKTIIAMARNLRLDTIAEGVETKEQHQLLTQYGCRMMQGFYFGHPMPADQFEGRLDADRSHWKRTFYCQ